MQNCRFEDNYVDMGFGNKINIPVYKCDPPATNAVWGMGAINPSAAVIEYGSGSDGMSMGTGVAMASGPASGPASVASVNSWFGMKAQPKLQGCNSDEIDMGLTCEKPPECKTEEDRSQPIKGLFGEVFGYMMKTTCSKGSSRAKDFR
jgi:hypothetical protein